MEVMWESGDEVEPEEWMYTCEAVLTAFVQATSKLANEVRQ